MDTLRKIVYDVIGGYAGEGLNSVSHLTQDHDGTVFTVTDFARIDGKHVAGISLVVRLIGALVVVERDQNDKLVLDALLQAGIPREQIILAYAGETIPEEVY